MQFRATPLLVTLSLTAVLAAGFGACAKSDDTLITTPTIVNKTDNFSGSIAQLGVAVHPFAMTTAGSLTIGLTAVGPLSTLALGVGIGTWDGTNCSANATQNDSSKSGVLALSGSAGAGNYCVRVYDSGNIVEGATATYTVQVVHP